MTYHEVYDAWKADPEAFWMKAADAISWYRKPSKALFDEKAPIYEWFSDGLLNICYNAVDRHVEAGHGAQTALIYDSPVTDTKQRISYADLQERVARLAGALQAQGVKKGDRVIIYMPMVPETMVGMLACARLGAVHSVVFGGFAANELAVRIDDCQPKAILSASCGIEPGRTVLYKPLLDEALTLARSQPDFCVVLQRDHHRTELIEGRDHDWHAFQQDAAPADCVPVEGNHPSYVLYTSGTTGQPKGVVRHSGGQLVALNWTMKNVYGVNPGEVFWAASDVGWVVGHSYICYGPLTHRNTSILFEGKPVGTPDASTYWRIISEYNVKSFFTAPTALRAVKREDPSGSLLEQYDVSSLRAIFLAGERADPDTIQWAQTHMKLPVIDHWWQTELGYPAVCNPLGIELMPIKIGSPSVPLPGIDMVVFDDNGQELPRGELGSIAIRLPLPPGTLPTLWNAEERFISAYLERFPGFYDTGDAGLIDEDGYVYVMSRTDDVINVAGHRLSTGAMEEVLASHPDIAECAVVGIPHDMKGQEPLGLLCLNAGCNRPHEEIESEIVSLVREMIGPVAAFRRAIVVERLPKTRSGKILRATIVKIVTTEPFQMPATIDDPAALDEMQEELSRRGLVQS